MKAMEKKGNSIHGRKAAVLAAFAAAALNASAQIDPFGPLTPYLPDTLDTVPVPKLLEYAGYPYVAVFTARSENPDDGTLEVSYPDGLDRDTQHVRVGAAPDGRDLLTMWQYDAWGRTTAVWQDVPMTAAASMCAEPVDVRSAAVTAYGDTDPSSLLLYEAAPLGREVSRYGPGAAWRQAGRACNSAYMTNKDGADSLTCLRHTAATVTEQGSVITVAGTYPDGTLSVARTADEDGRSRLRFTDRRGNTVLDRVVLGTGNSRTFLDTYYVYTVDGLLCAVLPPAIGGNPSSGTVPQSALDDYAYLYRHDGLRRVCGVKKPGAGWTRIAADTDGRVAYTQDAVQRTLGKSTFHAYDSLGRECLTGLCTYDVPTADAQLYAVQAPRCAFTGTGQLLGYTVSNVTLAAAVALTATYYDSYVFAEGIDSLSFRKGKPGGRQARWHYGLVTGKAAARLPLADTPVYSLAAFYYDPRERLIQTHNRNILGGYDSEYTGYDFTGRPVERELVHSAPRKATLTERYTYAYDHVGRPLTVTHSVNGSSPVMIARYTYDAMGRVAAKVTGGLETTSYDYNVRSWPTKIQGQRFLEVLAYEGTSWGITPSAPQWSGKVSAMLWTGSSVTDYRGYRFTYDGMGRLTAANYRTGSSLGTNAQTFNENLTYDAMGNVTSLKRRGPKDSGAGLIDDLTMEYDDNRLVKCDDAVASQPTYNAAHHFQDLADSAVEYEYDGNGNMTKDLNREITSIEYNSLNLPGQITFSDDTKMKFTYDAAGNKLRAEYWTIPTFNPGGPIGLASTIGGNEPMGGGIVGPILPPINQNDPQAVTDYCGNVIYRNDTLSMLLTEEGYVTFDERGEPLYHYYLKDHLGSVRIVMSQDGTVEQRNQYYPDGTLFGKQSTGGTVQPYKFGGKELERTLPLDEYDFSARWMDPVVGGRFTTMDSLAEKNPEISPFAYCEGDPVNRIDPNGKKDYKYNQKGYFYEITNIGQQILSIVGLNNKKDRVYSEETNKLIAEFPEGTIKLYSNSKRSTILQVNDIQQSEILFRLLIRNTEVEWARISGTIGQFSTNILTTRHKERDVSNSIDILYALQQYGFIVNTFDHSHVLSRETLQSNMGSLVFMSISGEDFLTASRHPDIIFRIYDVYNNLIQYYDENKIYKTETFN